VRCRNPAAIWGLRGRMEEAVETVAFDLEADRWWFEVLTVTQIIRIIGGKGGRGRQRARGVF